MICFDHQANQIDQVDSKIKDIEKVLHVQGEGYQQPIIFRSRSSQVSMSVEEVSLYFLGGDPIPYIGLVPTDPRSSFFGILISTKFILPTSIQSILSCHHFFRKKIHARYLHVSNRKSQCLIPKFLFDLRDSEITRTVVLQFLF